MKKLLVLLFVAAMCIPCYGTVADSNIFVYKFMRTFDPWIDYNDATRALATNVGTKQLTGYLVLNADVNTDANTWRLNADPTIIFYGGTGSDKWGVSFDVNNNVSDANGSMDVNLFSLRGKTDKGLLFVIDANTEQDRVGSSWSTVYGKTTGKIDTGKGAKKGVPSNMKGIVDEWADTNDFFEGFGNTTMTLNTLYTKWANAGSKTQAQTVTKIITDLVTYPFAGYVFAGSIQAKIDAALLKRASTDPLVTIIIPAGTYHESIVINEPNVTLKSASGKATTIIDPGASYQQAIEVSGEHVTIDGFTIKQGTQDFSAAHPQQHTIWVDANYSTIQNCTIIGARGNQACIFIGGRQADTPHGVGDTGIWGYNVATGTKGHKILNNAFRYGTATAGSGEGWGIFAVKLTDDCNIKGNTFIGDATNVADWDTSGNAPWNTSEGAPGTGITIHSAEKGSGTYAVTIQDNTAQYVKYTWLNFYSAYPFNLSATDTSPGKLYEMPEASEVNDVIVRNNTVHDLGKDRALHTSGTAITFQGKKISSDAPAYLPSGHSGSGDLTIGRATNGTGGVTITDNTFYDSQYGVWIKVPTSYNSGASYGCVLKANNILIGPDNSLYYIPSVGYGVYNGTNAAHQEVDASAAGAYVKIVDANDNWWGSSTGPYDSISNPHGIGSPVDANVTYSPYLTSAP